MMLLFWSSRILSLVVWVIHVVRWYRADGAVAFLYGLFLSFAVALIWFGDLLGEGEGFDVWRSPNVHPIIDFLFQKRLRVDTPSGGFVFKLLGWTMLLAPWWLPFLATPVPVTPR